MLKKLSLIIPIFVSLLVYLLINFIPKTSNDSSIMSKKVSRSVDCISVPEGDGARVFRSVGTSKLDYLDPFLMLDEFTIQAPAGFPDHPHRGFETVTYMLQGGTRHEDFCGHAGVINAGDLQWMTAGRGIVHSEMPASSGQNVGLQLWVNLSAKDKMIAPQYQELLAKDIPNVKRDGVSVKVIAGESMGVQSKVYTRTPTLYLDFTLDPGAKLIQSIPEGWTSFVYVLTGQAVFGPSDSTCIGKPHQIMVLSTEGNSVEAFNNGDVACHFVVIGGKPIGEPVARRGPFVMNTQEEISEAFSDYRNAKNGFENAHKWHSTAR